MLCTILGLLQHAYFENKVENKTYIYALRINSTDERKQKHAGNILLLNLLSMQQKCNLKECMVYQEFTNTNEERSIEMITLDESYETIDILSNNSFEWPEPPHFPVQDWS